MRTKCEIDMLILELTRRCNMRCAHCLRGDPQPLNMPKPVIDSALAPFAGGFIDTLTFGGGEPSLNVPGILYTLKQCEKLHIRVHHFYVVTNGKVVPDDFLIAMMKWYIYCGDVEGISGLALSKDCFHDTIPQKNEFMLRGFSFFKEDKFTDWDSLRGGLINMGRARNLDEDLRALSVYRPEIEENASGGLSFMESELYISARGDVYPSCDLEYDFPGLRLCSVHLENWVDHISDGLDKVFGEESYLQLTDAKIEELAGTVKASA